AHRAGAGAQQADRLAQQDRLAGAAAADQRHQLAAADGEVDPGVDLLAAQARLDADELDDRLGRRSVARRGGGCGRGRGRGAGGRLGRTPLHRPTSCRITAITASSRITATMLCTTVDVVLIPIERVSRLTDRPIAQPITPMTRANSGALARPITTCRR